MGRFDELQGNPMGYFQAGQETAGSPPIGAIAAGGIGDLISTVLRTRLQAQLEHSLRMQYDPQYRFQYQLYDTLNRQMATPQATNAVPASPMSQFSRDPSSGYITSNITLPGDEPTVSSAPAVPSTAGPNMMDPVLLQQAAVGKAFGFTPPIFKQMEAQATKTGELQGEYGNPEEAARLRAQTQASQAEAGSRRQQQAVTSKNVWSRLFGTPVPDQSSGATSPFTPTSSGLRIVGIRVRGQ